MLLTYGVLSFVCPTVLPRLSGAVCVIASSAAACHPISLPLSISSVCGALLPPLTIVSLRPATATR